MSNNSKIRTFVMPIAIILVLVGAVALGVVLNNQDKASESGEVLSSQIGIEERYLGAADAPVELVEYADFQCPACASYDPMVKRLMQENGDWVKFSYRHLPLKQIHKNAVVAAEAAEAAGELGNFWEMKEVLYAKQGEWALSPDPTGTFMDYAKGLGLNEEDFARAMRSGAVRQKVETDYRTTQSLGLNSTPTFFVNGKKISNPASYEKFVEELRSALEQ